MQELIFFKAVLDESLAKRSTPREPNGLYDPIEYILSLGGKRLRPVLTLLSCEFFGGDYKKALHAALAVELFHNFSLIHDDIMDEAPLRRGSETVHVKWDLNTGILSGDAMLILAYQYFESYEPQLFLELAQLFSKTALEVCEGQQYDIDFEIRNDVTILEYLKMIEFKTAVLLGAAMKMGAIVAQASETGKNGIYEFGKNLGIAFQLQDDYLDAFGDPESFGKQVGGDIISNKKTFLYLMALERGSSSEVTQLKGFFSTKSLDSEAKVREVKSLFQSTGAAEAIQTEIAKFTNLAMNNLTALDLSKENTQKLTDFGHALMSRKV